VLLKYSLHEPRRGRDDIKAFMTDFRAAFPDLNFRGTAGLIAEGDYVVGQWEGGGNHYKSGGLIQYGTSISWANHLLGIYTGRVLKGTRPGVCRSSSRPN
jgi:hypothetical protein